MRIVYIAGYGRSGSTLLDVLLGQSPGVVGTGEVTFLFRAAEHLVPCSCGEPLADCAVWGPVLADVEAAGFDFPAAERVTRPVDRGRVAPTDDYARLWRTVYDRLAAGGAAAVVDSSKSARNARGRAVALAELGHDVHVVHLRRRALDVLNSVRRGTNRSLQAGADDSRLRVPRAIVAKLLADRDATRSLAKLGGHDVRYEELVRDPSGALAPLLQSLPEPLAAGVREALHAAATGAALDLGHGIAGNRARAGAMRLTSPDLQ